VHDTTVRGVSAELRRPLPVSDELVVEQLTVGPGLTAAAALACFYLFGGLLTLVSLVLPGWDEMDSGSAVGIGIAAVASGALVLAVREHLSDVSCHVLVALGSLLVGAAMVAGRDADAAAAFASYFFFVGIYAALFFRPKLAAAHVGWAFVVHGVALHLAGSHGTVPSTFVRFGAVAATALVVGALVRQVRTAAATDPLTRLPNRRSFEEQLDRALARAERSGRPLSVLALDLDGFKAVNDRQGHAAGDRLLVESSKAWSTALRTGDVLARNGGDEFVVLLPDSGESIARRVADRLGSRTPDPLGVSVGVAVSRGGEDGDALLRRADQALYAAKRSR